MVPVGANSRWMPSMRIGTGRGNPASLIRLKDGRLVLTYGYRAEPNGIRARVSADGGRTWQPEIVLRSDGGNTDLGYPRSVQRADGKVDELKVGIAKAVTPRTLMSESGAYGRMNYNAFCAGTFLIKDADGVIQPNLMTDWEINEDGTEMVATFATDQGITLGSTAAEINAAYDEVELVPDALVTLHVVNGDAGKLVFEVATEAENLPDYWEPDLLGTVNTGCRVTAGNDKEDCI